MRRRRPQSLRLLLAALVLCGAATACNKIADALATDLPNPDAVTQVRVQREAVVPSLLPLIDQNALFRFPTPNVGANEMPLDTAVSQAAEYLFYGLNHALTRGMVEGQRGAFIDFPTLVPCGRPQLARSVYDAPPDSLPSQLRMQLGGTWRIPFCGSRRTPELVVSVATLANKARFRNSQPVGDTVAMSLAFSPAGVPWEWDVEHIVTPEEAVNEVYTVTGARAAKLPELAGATEINGRPAGGPVWCPVWRVALDRPVRVTTAYSQRLLNLTELYVRDSQCPGLLGRTMLLTAGTDQPATREFALIIPDATDPTGFRRIVHVARYTVPVVFESVTVAK